MNVDADYTGHVDPGGRASTRTAGDLTITKVSVGPMDNNAYLLVCNDTRDALLIDAANDADRLMELIAAQQPAVRLAGVVTTHRHADHWQALSAVVGATGATVFAGSADADELPVPVNVRLEHGDRIDLGSASLRVIALRGHTPGSVAIRYDESSGAVHLFTGDSLFPGGPGRTTSPADYTSLMDELEGRVFGEMPDGTWVYPGHGDDTTLGAERPQVAEWRARGG
jgi:glyoxylase-like metal-dependent hydrolase (beta-lactamase superfamily II)